MCRCGGQSRGTEPLSCGTGCYLWVDGGRTELNCRTPDGCDQELLVVGQNHTLGD